MESAAIRTQRTLSHPRRELRTRGVDRVVADDEQVMSYHEEFGAEFMWFMVDWPGMDPSLTLETIERFGKEVIPQIKRQLNEAGEPFSTA